MRVAPRSLGQKCGHACRWQDSARVHERKFPLTKDSSVPELLKYHGTTEERCTVFAPFLSAALMAGGDSAVRAEEVRLCTSEGRDDG